MKVAIIQHEWPCHVALIVRQMTVDDKNLNLMQKRAALNTVL